MSFWQKLKDRLTGDTKPPDDSQSSFGATLATPARGRAENATSSELPSVRAWEIELANFGSAGGATSESALETLRRARGTADESRALSALLKAWGRVSSAAANTKSPPEFSELLRVECAEILVERGEEARALEILEGARLSAALMLVADLSAASGDFPRALGAIERVLARDISAPGAIERHARWSAQLGASARGVKRSDEATMVAAAPQATSFTVLREVARGGAGAVYEAMDELLGRRIAFKVYHREGEDRAMVEREVRYAAKLAGPGVVRIFDAAPEAGWIALEWVGQGSLREWIRERREGLSPVVSWALPLARALERIHHAGVVHADVKPANVLLRSATTPLLSDFGIARPVGSKSGGGSVGYLSPERMAGEPTSFQDDVYGLGRTIEDALEALDPSGSTTEPKLRQIVDSCLAPAKSRYADAGEIVRALAALT